jgi:hypothetical protein
VTTVTHGSFVVDIPDDWKAPEPDVVSFFSPCGTVELALDATADYLEVSFEVFRREGTRAIVVVQKPIRQSARVKIVDVPGVAGLTGHFTVEQFRSLSLAFSAAERTATALDDRYPPDHSAPGQWH